MRFLTCRYPFTTKSKFSSLRNEDGEIMKSRDFLAAAVPRVVARGRGGACEIAHQGAGAHSRQCSHESTYCLHDDGAQGGRHPRGGRRRVAGGAPCYPWLNATHTARATAPKPPRRWRPGLG